MLYFIKYGKVIKFRIWLLFGDCGNKKGDQWKEGAYW